MSRFARLHGHVWTALAGVAVLAVLLFNFRFFFPALGQNAFTDAGREDTPDNIPQSLNFLNDDKKAFLSYCGVRFGETIPFTVDPATFLYYGAADGFHLYRMQAALVETGPARQSVRLGKYVFSSDRLYRPSTVGLYLIRDGQVYDLETAYRLGLVDIARVYELYAQKSGLQTPDTSSKTK